MKLVIKGKADAIARLQTMLEERSYPPEWEKVLGGASLKTVTNEFEPSAKGSATISSSLKEDSSLKHRRDTRLEKLMSDAESIGRSGHSEEALVAFRKLKKQFAGTIGIPLHIKLESMIGAILVAKRNRLESEEALRNALELAKHFLHTNLPFGAAPNQALIDRAPIPVRDIILDVYNGIGEWWSLIGGDEKIAYNIHTLVFNLRKEYFGAENKDTLLSLNNLAEVLRKTNQTELAKAMHQSAYLARRKSLGRSNTDTLVSLWNLILTQDQSDGAVRASELQGELMNQLRAKNGLNPIENQILKYAEMRAVQISTHAPNVAPLLGDVDISDSD